MYAMQCKSNVHKQKCPWKTKTMQGKGKETKGVLEEEKEKKKKTKGGEYRVKKKKEKQEKIIGLD